MNRNAVLDFGLHTLRHSALRRDLKKNSVLDAGICHGSSGIAHIFNRLFQNTGDPLFKESALYWYQVTLDMANGGAKTFAGYQAYNGLKGWLNEVNMLEGVSGIGLSLLSAVSTFEPEWDKCFLINLDTSLVRSDTALPI